MTTFNASTRDSMPDSMSPFIPALTFSTAASATSVGDSSRITVIPMRPWINVACHILFHMASGSLALWPTNNGLSIS
ncbi:MAG: hypothetical protein ACR2RL_15640 [Gammaproteobacteria bacterium]